MISVSTLVRSPSSVSLLTLLPLIIACDLASAALPPGYTSGAFSVNAGGAATFSLPVRVPAGAAGVTLHNLDPQSGSEPDRLHPGGM